MKIFLKKEKKLTCFLASFILVLLFTGCSVSETALEPDAEVSNENQQTVPKETKSAEPQPEGTISSQQMTPEELEAQLAAQPLCVIKTEYVVQDADYKALYPDILSAVFQNNSGTDIKSVVIGFVAWDENNFPVKIKHQHNYSSGRYFETMTADDVNMINGSTYGEDSGMPLSEDCANISTIKAIAVSYTDFNGNTWENPLLDEFKELYENKKLN